MNRWVLEQFRDVLGQRVLEAGCGIGNFTELLLDRERLVCLDNDPLYVEMLNWRLGHLENVTTSLFDLADSAAYQPIKPERIDTIVCLNVLEHIAETSGCFARTSTCWNLEATPSFSCRRTRRCSAPAMKPWATSGATRSVELEAKLQQAGFEVVRLDEFNRLGVPGWYLNKLLGRRDLNPRQMRAFEWLLPVAKGMERLKLGRGLSLIGIGRKPVASAPPR